MTQERIGKTPKEPLEAKAGYRRGFRVGRIVDACCDMTDGLPVNATAEEIKALAYGDTDSSNHFKTYLRTIKFRTIDMGEESARERFKNMGQMIDYIRSFPRNEDLSFAAVLEQLLRLEPIGSIPEPPLPKKEELIKDKLEWLSRKLGHRPCIVPPVSRLPENGEITDFTLTPEQQYWLLKSMAELPDSDYERTDLRTPWRSERLKWKEKAESFLIKVDFSQDRLPVLTDLKLKLLGAKKADLDLVRSQLADKDISEFIEKLVAGCTTSRYAGRVGALIKLAEKAKIDIVKIPNWFESVESGKDDEKEA